MYRQIEVHPEDQPLQRILWRSNLDEPVQVYQLQTVTYGTACASFLALRVLQQLAKDEGAKFPRAAALLRRSTYVDDVVAGAATIDEALALQQKLVDLLKAGGFHLRKWAANRPRLLDSVLPDNRLPLVPLREREELGTPLLGIHWIPEEDAFGYNNPPLASSTNTKRTILSTISRIFDPLGWIAPVIISGKILLQELWMGGVDWDEPLPESLEERWRQYQRDLNTVHLRLPRWTGHLPNTEIGLRFCDASKRAYAAVVYSVVRPPRGPAKSRLLAAKSKVAPVKRVSLPRLELCGAHLLARVMRFVTTTLLPTDTTARCWTDSTVALAWITQHPSRWDTFVANRVGAIHKLVPSVPWGHVPTKENPADCASRGMPPDHLQSLDLWWSGPTWLLQSAEHWPKWARQQEASCNAVRLSGVPTTVATRTPPVDWEGVIAASSYGKAVRIMAYVWRFHDRAARTAITISTEEYRRAEQRFIAVTQRAFFSEDLRRLHGGRQVATSSQLRPLQPALDTDGVLRMEGRLRFTSLPCEQRRPILMPRESRLTELLVLAAHARTLHGGVQLTLTRVRQRFWIPAGRALVRQVLHRCVVCARQRATPLTPIMAPLPRERAASSPPFRTAGVDYAGPVSLTATRGRGRTATKGYIAVFVCFATRAVHLELVGDYSSDAFLAAFHRFAARRGLPAVLYSDQGTTFVGANRELRTQFRAALDVGGPVAAALVADGTDWRFVPPSSPHFGGLWEAGVRSLKHHLRRVLDERLLSVEEFSTWLARVEACLNSRPLSPLTDDPDDLDVLTPGHFLIGRPLNAIPEPHLANEPENHLTRWQMLQRLADHLWTRWSQEFLAQLQARRKWTSREDPPRVGDLVVIRDTRLPPTKWALAHEVGAGSNSGVISGSRRSDTSGAD